MSEKSKPDQYAEYIRSHILPFIDYNELQASYKTDMIYAKGILNRLHEAMVSVYGSETLDEQDGDKGFVVVPGVLCGSKSKDLCIALFTLDLSSSGEHWGTDFLCKYGVISQDGNSAVSNNGSVMKSEIKEILSAYIPYDYGYTATIPRDIHIEEMRMPEVIKFVLEDFRNHRAELMFEPKTLQVVADAFEAAGMDEHSDVKGEVFDGEAALDGDCELIDDSRESTALTSGFYEKLDRNLADSLALCRETIANQTLTDHELVRLADNITAISSAYYFLKEDYDFKDGELKVLAKCDYPLDAVAAEWSDIAGYIDINEGMRDFLENSEGIMDHPLIVPAKREAPCTPDELLTQIAKKHCRFETLETRNSDSLDFHDVSVWGLKAALEEAYTAGLTRQIERTTVEGAVREDVRHEHTACEKPSVLEQIREAAKTPKEPHRDNPARDKSGPEL